jgi:hypothetical protein
MVHTIAVIERANWNETRMFRNAEVFFFRILCSHDSAALFSIFDGINPERNTAGYMLDSSPVKKMTAIPKNKNQLAE